MQYDINLPRVLPTPWSLPVLLFILSLCGFSGALATRLLDPLITSIAAEFATTVGVVALLSSAFALPFGLSQPLLGPTGDAFGKAVVIKVATAVLALCLLTSALAPQLTVLFISRILGGVAAGGVMHVCMALIGDRFPLAVRQVAMSRYIGATLIGQLVGVSAGGIIAEWIGWRGVLACAAVLAGVAAGAAITMLPKSDTAPAPLRVGDALARYRLVLSNPRSFVCFGVVFLEGLAIYGITPFIGELLRSRGAGGLRETGFVIGGLGIGGLLFAFVVPFILKFAKRPTMMAIGGTIAAVRLGGLGLEASWKVQLAFMVVLGFGFSCCTIRFRPRGGSSHHRRELPRSRCTLSAFSLGRRSAQWCTESPCQPLGRPSALLVVLRSSSRPGSWRASCSGQLCPKVLRYDQYEESNCLMPTRHDLMASRSYQLSAS